MSLEDDVKELRRIVSELIRNHEGLPVRIGLGGGDKGIDGTSGGLMWGTITVAPSPRVSIGVASEDGVIELYPEWEDFGGGTLSLKNYWNAAPIVGVSACTDGIHLVSWDC